MSEPVTVTLPGEPVAKGRPRFAKGRAYTPAKTVTYANKLKAEGIMAMRGRKPLTGPLEALVVAAFGVPASWSQGKRLAALAGSHAHTIRPDADNILKGLDALNGVVFEDDAQIVRADVRKVYAAEPCLTVRVTPC